VFVDEEISGGCERMDLTLWEGWYSMEQGEEIKEHREVDIGKITDKEEGRRGRRSSGR